MREKSSVTWILCPANADFDTVGAAIGLSLLYPAGQVVLSGTLDSSVQTFLQVQDWGSLLLRREAELVTIPERVILVNAQHRDRLGDYASYLELPNVQILLYDRQIDLAGSIVFQQIHVDAVGATSTIVVEALQKQAIAPPATVATCLALGIHTRTASLTANQTTSRDGMALAWLMAQGANQRFINQYATTLHQGPAARDLMSSPVRTIRPETTIAEAQRILLRYGHSGLSVVDERGQLVGLISRRDIDIALHHDFGDAPVRAYMTTTLKTISPITPLAEIEALMVVYDIGRLPVIDQGQLVGIVTRTDVLRQLYRQSREGGESQEEDRDRTPGGSPLPISHLQRALTPELWQILNLAARSAERQGWHLYLVGGGVRDALLARSEERLNLSDIDLVVDSFHQPVRQGAGVELAHLLLQANPEARLQVHGQFQTAALLWHNHPILESLWVDIATARTEFYPYPAANPEVEASSIQQDLYRRDFTVNAMALRLTEPGAGQLLDFFGGWLDLQDRQIRVLHANSFIEDPTRIYRAVRFAVKLGFTIEAQTERYIRYALATGIYDRIQNEQTRVPALQTRLKAELKYILQAHYWQEALRLLAYLGAFRCLHATLEPSPQLWRQLRFADRLLRCLDPVGDRLSHWQVLLEVLIAYLAPEYRGKVASNLQLAGDSVMRLSQLASLQQELADNLVKLERPSQIVQRLKGYDTAMLLLVAIRSDRVIRRLIWRYLSEWSQVKSPLDGNALKRLGYKPGEQFRQILMALAAATVDGEIFDRGDAEAYLARYFPLP